MEEHFLEKFQNHSQHLQEDVKSSVLQSFHQYNDALRGFKGKSKIAVVSQSSFTRNHLADAAFSLKEVCESLLGVVINIVKEPAKVDQAGIINDVSNKMQETLTHLMKGFETSLLGKINSTPARDNKRMSTNVDNERHVI